MKNEPTLFGRLWSGARWLRPHIAFFVAGAGLALGAGLYAGWGGGVDGGVDGGKGGGAIAGVAVGVGVVSLAMATWWTSQRFARLRGLERSVAELANWSVDREVGLRNTGGAGGTDRGDRGGQ